MPNKNIKIISLTTLGTILFATLSYFIIGSFLVFEKHVKSPYIILEGWLPNVAIENTSSYFFDDKIDSVFIFSMKKMKDSIQIEDLDKTNKLKKNKNTYSIYWNGTLGFEIPTKKLDDTYNLNVKMRGTASNKIFPHYKIFVNENLIQTGFVNKKDSIFKFVISKKTNSSLTHILINFDNDSMNTNEDRNLYVSDIKVGSKDINSIAINNFFIPSNIKPNINFISEFCNIKHLLTDLGFDSSKIKLIEVDESPFNKTLGLAKGVKKYFHNTEIKNINIITASHHSRRSYLNFKNSLKNNIEIGCISAENNVKNKSLLKRIDDRASLLLTWIYWGFN